MKNVINYYYSLYPDKIYQTKREYYFFINNIRYSLTKYNEEENKLKEIYTIQNLMINYKIPVHQIILNIERRPITRINGVPHILLKTLMYGEEITLNKILSFSYIIADQNFIKWSKKWSVKNDYLEFQIRELGKKYKKIQNSFSYYIGLGETAIAISNTVEKIKVNCSYAHKRISNTDTTYNLYNPLNIIVDTRIRDVAEYLKSAFFNGKNIKKEIYYYLNSQNLSSEETILFLARMLYPTYYFDLYEEIITGKIEEEKIDKITSKEEEYENILREVYYHCKNKVKIFTIEWLE